MRVVLSKKGQIVIPKTIRDRFGLKEGDLLDVEAKEDMIVLKPAGTVKKVHDWREFRGVLKGKYSIEQFLAERQKDREMENIQ